MHVVSVDVQHAAPLFFEREGVTYQITGKCLRCGKCCLAGSPQDKDCDKLAYDQDGKAVCKIHESKPWYCFLYPATRDPALPYPSGCGFKLVKVTP